jgi:hypothetical protein
MSMHLDPSTIVWDRFGGLEPADPAWSGDRAYWEEFTAAFFAANGRDYDTARDSNVDAWITASDRAPFSDMTEALLKRLSQQMPLGDVEMVLLAHWLPDLHLGSSVTNFAMHHLGLDDCTGFAISDRGLSAPFFALDCLDRCLKGGTGKALLLVMDQKNLLYRSPSVEAINPANAAAAILLTREPPEGRSLCFAGYRRIVGCSDEAVAETVADARQAFGLREDARIIAANDVPGLPDADIVMADTTLVCSAPFASLAEAGARDTLLVLREEQALTVVGLKETVSHAH